MASRPIEIVLGIDSGDAERGADRVADALDDISGASEDLGRSRGVEDFTDAIVDAADATTDLGTDTERAMADVEDSAAEAARVIDRDLTQALESAADSSADAGRRMGDGIDEGTSAVSEGTEQMRDDATANATEMAASFDGSVGSMTDAAQGFVSEGLAGFGPAGAAAGIGVALGMGVVMSNIEEAKEKAQETAESIAEIAGQLIDMGDGANVRSAELITDRLKEMATTAEEGEIPLLDLRDAADKFGLSFEDLARGMAGDSDAATRAIAEIVAEQERLNAINNENMGAKYNSATGKANSERRETVNLLEEQKQALMDENGLLDSGTEAYEAYASIVDEGASAQAALTEETLASIEATREAANAALEASNAQIGYMASVQDTTETIAENGATLDLNTEAGRNNQSALNDLAGDVLALADASKANGAATAESNAKMAEGRTAFINAATAAGQTTEAANALADSYGLVPEKVTTAVTVTGTAQATTDLDGVTAPRTVSVSPSISSSVWDNLFTAQLKTKTYTVPVTPSIIKNGN